GAEPVRRQLSPVRLGRQPVGLGQPADRAGARRHPPAVRPADVGADAGPAALARPYQRVAFAAGAQLQRAAGVEIGERDALRLAGDDRVVEARAAAAPRRWRRRARPRPAARTPAPRRRAVRAAPSPGAAPRPPRLPRTPRAPSPRLSAPRRGRGTARWPRWRGFSSPR